MRFRFLLLFCLAGCSDRDDGADLTGTIEELPSQVIAAAGEVTLFADFANAHGGHVRLYVVNRTQRPVSIATQRGRPFLKLEARSESGRWERAEGHRYVESAWVTDNYYPVRIPEGTFRVFDGLFPEHGEARTVRFRDYDKREQRLVSNIGEGRVAPADILSAKRDRMSSYHGSEEDVVAIAVGDVVPVTDDGPVRVAAIENLVRFKNWRVAGVLARLLDDEDPSVVCAAVSVIDTFEELAHSAHKRLIQLTGSSNTRVRRASVRACGRLRIDESLPVVLPRLEDEDAGVRRNAAGAVAVLGSQAAIPHLQRLRDDPNKAVRDKAAWAVEAIRNR